MSSQAKASASRIVIVGAGQAGATLANALRAGGGDARTVLIGAERYFPYERPPLSKGVLAGVQPFASCSLWKEQVDRPLGVDCRFGSAVASIDVRAHTLALVDGARVEYDKVVLATGGRPRRLAIPGGEHAHCLRDIDDCNVLAAALRRAKRLLVVGGGWLGLEVAASARSLGVEVVLVETLSRLCARVVPEEIGALLHRLHRSHGVDIRLSTDVLRIDRDATGLTAVISGGERLECDVIVASVGMLPNIELARNAGIAVGDGIIVDEHGCTSDPDVYAVGDVALYPNQALGRRVRLESWSNANTQATALSRVLMDAPIAPAETPWFWSDQYDVNLQMLGMPERWNVPVVRGDRETFRCSMFYLGADGTLDAVIAMNAPRDIAIARRLISRKVAPNPRILGDAEIRLDTLLKSA